MWTVSPQFVLFLFQLLIKSVTLLKGFINDPVVLLFFPDELKTLMFFDGCPSNLGCTIKLRGASEYELARVKDIIMMMVFVAYHSRLEISFLMDEFAMPPSLSKSSSFHCLLESAAEEAEKEVDMESQENQPETKEELAELHLEGDFDFEPGLQEIIQGHNRQHSASESTLKDGESPKVIRNDSPMSTIVTEGDEIKTSTPLSSQSYQPLCMSPPYLSSMEEIIEEEVNDQAEAVRSREDDNTLVRGNSTSSETPLAPIQLFRDPLQDDSGMFVAEQVTSADDRLKSISASFRQELKDVILCISPFMTFREPFLLTPPGLRCPSRDYFPEQVYFSLLLNKDLREVDSRRKRILLKDTNSSSTSLSNGLGTQQRQIRVLPSHKLTTTCMTQQLSSSQDLARMLADYRAQGGRIQRDTDPFAHPTQPPNTKAPVKADGEEEKGPGQNDMVWATKVCTALHGRQNVKCVYDICTKRCFVVFFILCSSTA